MPDIGLLQGQSRRRAASTRIIAPRPERASPPVPPAAARSAPVDAIAVRYAAAPGEGIHVPAGAPVVSASAAAAAPPPEAPIGADDPTVVLDPPPRRQAAASIPPIRGRDLLWLALALLVIIGTGIGIRAPWPADEPRFAVIARDMVATGEWLFPRVGGDLYQDKPPLFFWMLAACYALFGSIRWSFLIPSLLSAAGTLFLVYDFGRRLVSREAGLAAALLTVCTLQFALVMRGAQIDPVLCGLTTFSLYALLRHLLLGPAWGWYCLGGFVAGLGVITKGVGFLPLLALLPFFTMRAFRWQGLARIDAGAGGWRWWLAPFAMLVAICLWFVPMLVAVEMSGAPEYAAYRDEILFKQTVSRYAAAWHHVKPWYYFLVEVIPPLWLPFSLLLFWLVPRFRAAWRDRDARVWLPLGWSLLVLLFFSLSPGKRGVYIHPALPALALASLPVLPQALARRGVRRLGWALALLFLLAALAAWVLSLTGTVTITSDESPDSLPVRAFALVYVVVCGLGLLAARRFASLAAWPVALGSLCVAFSYVLAPAMNPERSDSRFIARVLGQVRPEEELALVAYKEQFLLYLDRPTVNFGHRRWLEGPQEAYDAAAWLDAGPFRVLLVPAKALEPCFPEHRDLAGRASDEDWYLVRGPARADCAAQGDASKAIHYEAKRN
ncbi:MAG TPA: glycosyltransferase family 39 protein [Steroidobacteraceae bacterium]|nr:glycosyltransferase family 39 protein [Steroidobacteraceae bacterium]